MAPRYPVPAHATIIEPFAGAAGYSLRYPDRDVILVEKYPVIAGIWRYLIAVKESEIRAIPLVDAVDDLPAWVPEEARNLIGFQMNCAHPTPCKTLSAGLKRNRANGRTIIGWGERRRELVANQVEHIRHWKIIEGDYGNAPDAHATWFIDPPYNNRAGQYYKHCALDYTVLGDWCETRRGQVMVCENVGAAWLPFQPFIKPKSTMGRTSAVEAIFYMHKTHYSGMAA